MLVGTVQNHPELPECPLGCFDLVGIVYLPGDSISMGKAVVDLTRKVRHKVAGNIQISFSSFKPSANLHPFLLPPAIPGERKHHTR